ncbi:MAG: ankyrin repeat domain-containing protein, partial [bacterium]
MRLSVIVFFIITLATSLFGENELLPALVSGGQPIVPLQIITQLGGERFYSPETPPPPGVDGYKYNEGGIFFGNKTCCLFYLLNKNIAEINGKNHYYKYKTSLNPSFRLLNEVGIIYVSLDLIKLIFEIKVPFNAHSRSLTFVNPATKKEFILPITADMSYTGKPEVDELQVASALGDFDSVRHIISSHPELMNISANWDGQTALCRAVDGNHEQIVRYMISHGADVNGNHKSNTPLVLAAKNGNIPIARMLIH